MHETGMIMTQKTTFLCILLFFISFFKLLPYYRDYFFELKLSKGLLKPLQ